MSRIQSSSEFASTVIECIKKYVQKEKKTKTMNVNQKIIECQTELATLFTKAKKQQLFIHKKDVWGIDGIAAYLIRLPLVQQTGYIKGLRTVLYNLLTQEFADLIVEDTALPQTRSVPTPSSRQIKVKSFTAKDTALEATALEVTIPTRKITLEPHVARREKTITSPTEILPDEVRIALHTFVFNKADRDKINLNCEIQLCRTHYLEARNMCKKCLPYVGELPPEIQQAKGETERRLYLVRNHRLGEFKSTEINHYLYDNIAKVLTYLKDQFPTEKS